MPLSAYADPKTKNDGIWRLPLGVAARNKFDDIYWEKDAHFLAPRTGGYLHPAIDLMPSDKTNGIKVFAASYGKVVSIYAREPHRSIMIEHSLADNNKLYTVYVHITDIKVKVGDIVDTDDHLANLMDAEQLNEYGWRFNHLHFEILKSPRIDNKGKLLSYSTRCNTEKEVHRHYYDPVTFLNKMWEVESKRITSSINGA